MSKTPKPVRPLKQPPEVAAPVAAPRRPGRPRSTSAQDKILAACVELIRESGYDALAMEAIAARAGVGKTTVYRHWPSKEFIAAEAIARIVLGIAVPDTGGVETDVLALMRSMKRMYDDPGTVTLLPALVAAIARSTRVADAVRTGMASAWHAVIGRVLERAIERGELRADVDVEVAIELLAGPLFYRYLWLGLPIDESYLQAVVAAVLSDFMSSKAARGARRK